MPPIRSPLANDARIASAASAHARLGSRFAESGPVTMCSRRCAGRDGDEHRAVVEALEQRLGVRAGRRFELADVDGEGQPGLAAGQRERLVEAAELPRGERAVAAELTLRAVLQFPRRGAGDLTTHRWHLRPRSSVAPALVGARDHGVRVRDVPGRRVVPRLARPVAVGLAHHRLAVHRKDDERDDAAGMPTNTSTVCHDSHGATVANRLLSRRCQGRDLGGRDRRLAVAAGSARGTAPRTARAPPSP